MGCTSSAEPKKPTQLRLLLQGTGGCGKSTFAKQMRILHSGGFTGEELQYFKNTLIANIFLGLKALISAAEDGDQKVENEKILRYFDDVNPYNVEWSAEAAEKAKLLYADPAIAYARENLPKTEFAESLQYAMAKIDDLLDANWNPANDDVLHARGRTTGVLETKFTTDKFEWILIDVGGQTVERRKWTNLQNGLQGVLYFAAVDEYDVPSEEVDGLTKLQVSLNIWDEVIHGDAIAGQVAIILFLNKADLLEKRLKKSPKSLKKAFKDYTGGKDVDKALEFFKSKFMGRIREGTAASPSQVYVHATCALDTNQMNLVFNSVRDFVVQQRMMRANLI